METPAHLMLQPQLAQLLRRVAAGQILLGMELSAPPQPLLQPPLAQIVLLLDKLKMQVGLVTFQLLQPLLQHLIQALRRVAAGQLKVGMDSPAKPRPLTPRFQLRLASLPNKYEMRLAPVTFHLE